MHFPPMARLSSDIIFIPGTKNYIETSFYFSINEYEMVYSNLVYN